MSRFNQTPSDQPDGYSSMAERRWSTPGGELSFVLPEGWTASSVAASDGLVIQVLLPGGSGQCTLMAGSLAAQERGQPEELLIQLGLQQIGQALPHLRAEPVAPVVIGDQIPAKACLFSGINPNSGKEVRAWVALGVRDGHYLRVFFEAVYGAGFAEQLAKLQDLLASLQPPKPNPQAQTALVGTWRCQYEGNYGVYVDLYTFAPDGTYRLAEGSDFYFGGTGPAETGVQAGPFGFADQSGKVGTYQVAGNTLILNDPEKGVITYPIQIGAEALFLGDKQFQRAR